MKTILSAIEFTPYNIDLELNFEKLTMPLQLQNVMYFKTLKSVMAEAGVDNILRVGATSDYNKEKLSCEKKMPLLNEAIFYYVEVTDMRLSEDRIIEFVKMQSSKERRNSSVIPAQSDASAKNGYVYAIIDVSKK